MNTDDLFVRVCLILKMEKLMSDYLNFDEASALLNTPRSTLYRWLKEGQIPGHKLGRQWRFLRSELDAFIHKKDGDTRGLNAFVRRLIDKREDQVMNIPTMSIQEISDQLIWHAVDQNATVIHLSPRNDVYQVKYRINQDLNYLDELSSNAFEQLDEYWLSTSHPIEREGKRRLLMERQGEDGVERVHIRYQKLDTFGGERLVLHLIEENRLATSINMIVNTEEEQSILQRWSQASSGLILISGRTGSGKTTTAYCLLQEIAQADDRVIFTMEDSVEFALERVNQVSVDLSNEGDYRRTFIDIMNSDLDVLFISSNFAQRHRSVLWNSALSAAESGHLVLVQLEADSVEDARNQFNHATNRSIDDHLVGVVWQSLKHDPKGEGRIAQYDFFSGSLDELTKG